MSCIFCGGSPLTCTCLGGFNGTGPTPQAPLGSAAASQHAGFGANPVAQQNTLFSHQAALQQALGSAFNAGLGGLAGVGGFNVGQMGGLGAHHPLEPPKPLEKAGTTFGEFVGWRIWGLSRGYLTSSSADYAWMPGHPAEGRPDDHGSGGIWAFKDRGHALNKAIGSAGLHLPHPVEGWATGSVWLFGEIIEHQIGYRAQYATIRSIDALVPNEAFTWKDWRTKREFRAAAKEMLAELRERYGVTP